MNTAEALQRAVDIIGNRAILARHLGLTRQAVHQWGKIPPRYVIPIERLAGGAVTRHELRPDIYPEE